MPKNTAIYSCDCTSEESLRNPLVGVEVGMQVSGFFKTVQPSYEVAFPGDNIHVSRGGLEKTISNGGAIFCQDSSQLFSMDSGIISMRICLPDYDIVNGVYKGLGTSKGTLEDFILFGVNMGEHYIAQPGLYGALTKNGVEFTIWSSAGRETLLETNLNVEAGDDIVLNFIWDKNGILGDETSNMSITANNILAYKEAEIESDSLSDVGGVGFPASFWVLDTPYRKNDLHIILRRLEIYSSADSSERLTARPLKTFARDIESGEYISSGVSTLSFEIIASQGPCVNIDSPDFFRVAISDVDMRAIGPIASSSHKNGEDLGNEKIQTLPAVLLDLPPGFVETRRIEP